MAALTYGVMQERILRTLADPDQNQNGEDVVYDAIIASHNAILQWVPYLAVATLTSGSLGNTTRTFKLPDDVYQIDAVVNLVNNTVLERSTLSPGDVRPDDNTSIPKNFIEFPQGYINIDKEISAGEQVEIFYRAFWPVPADVDEDFTIVVPSYAHQGMIYYACSHCLLPRSVASGGIRQYGTKVDSGTPDDNPLYNMSNWFLKLFINEMKWVPKYQQVGV